MISRNELHNSLNYAKIIRKKNHNFDLALRKRLFCIAKPTLLPCKRAAFGTQNNRFYNPLIMNKLRNRWTCEKYLHTLRSFLTYIIRYIVAFEVSTDNSLCQRKSDLQMKKHYLPHPNGKAADCIKNRTPSTAMPLREPF